MTRTEFERKRAEYLAALPSMNRSEQTVTLYSGVLRRFGGWVITYSPNEQITQQTVGVWRETLHDAGVSANSIALYLTVLRAFFKWATADVDISQEIPDKKTKEYTLLTEQEIQALLEAPVKKLPPMLARNRAIVVLMLQSGLRNSEVRALCMDDLDFENGKILVRHGKGDKKRVVPFPALARAAVKRYLQAGIRPETAPGTAPLFGSSSSSGRGNRYYGGKWHELSGHELNEIVKRYVRKITGKTIHAHTLRHAAASVWADIGVNIRDVQNALGHSSFSTTERVYLHVLNREKAAENINRAFDQNRREG